MNIKTITIDVREPSSFVEKFSSIAKERGFEIKIGTLDFGDFKCGNIIIERKEINDFAASVTSDRMYSQLFRMKENPSYSSIVLVYGNYEDLNWKNKDKIPNIKGGEYKILRMGIPILFLSNEDSFIDITLKLFEYSEDMDIPIKKIKKDGTMSTFRALDGCGKKTADILQKKYKCLGNLTRASKEEIQELIGNKVGERVYNSLWGVK